MATGYTGDLGEGRSIYLENQGSQTLITFTSSTSGQQQSQQSGFMTGEWTAPPSLFRTARGMIAQLQTSQGHLFVQVQDGGMQVMSTLPPTDAEVMPMQGIAVPQAPSQTRVEPMKPIEPMKPMKLGDMEMQMNPMRMRMGNMEMQMGEASSQSQTERRFCTQCGHSVDLDDRFCAQCGHRLQGKDS